MLIRSSLVRDDFIGKMLKGNVGISRYAVSERLLIVYFHTLCVIQRIIIELNKTTVGNLIHNFRQLKLPVTGIDSILNSDHLAMFIVEKAQLSSHFRSLTKKSTHVPKNYQLAARSFDEKVILHLKTLDLAPNSSNISLSWLSAAVSFLSTVHSEAEDQISNLKSEADDYQALYMDYSLKVLDLCNLISSAVQRLTDRRLLMNFSLRLLNFTDQIPSPEKLNKAKDVLARSINGTQESAKEKGRRAKDLMEELAVVLGKLLPRSKTSSGRDLIRRTFYALGALTVFIGSVLVAVLYGDFDVVELRVPAEFLWADSVNGLQNRIFDLIKPKQNAVLELDNVTRQAVVVRDLLQVVVSDGGDNVDGRVRLEDGVKELGTAAKKFSDGIDALTNGINGMFRTVLNTRNGRLDI